MAAMAWSASGAILTRKAMAQSQATPLLMWWTAPTRGDESP